MLATHLYGLFGGFEGKIILKGTVWRAVYVPGDGQTSPAYSCHSVQCLYISRLLSVNKLVLSYLLRLLPQ
jgi:hypothetical protein